MWILTVFIVTVGLISVSYGQVNIGLLITPVVNVTTVCGNQSNICYDNQRSVINATTNARDFTGACLALKTALNCIDQLTGYDCSSTTGDTDRKNVRKGALDDQGGLCNEDGTVSKCGTDVKTCLTNMDTVISLLQSKNATSACPAIAQFETCTNTIIKNGECAEKLITKLKSLSGVFIDDALLVGCDGACGTEIGDCLAKLAEFTADTLTSSASLTNYCAPVYAAIDCIKALPSNSASKCNDNSNDKTGVTLVSSVAQSQENAISDICNKDGTTTNCVLGFTTCSENLKSLSKQSSTSQQCQAVSAYLECTHNLPCFNALKATIDQTNAKLQNDEQQTKCPFVGSCDNRFNICANLTKGMTNANYSDSQSCNQIRASYTCYDVVRKDPVCSREAASVSSVETTINQSFSTICGGFGGTADVTNFSLLLFLACLLVSIRSYL